MVRRAFHLTGRQWLLLGEAALAMGLAWLQLRLLPFRMVAATWGAPQKSPPATRNLPLATQAAAVGWSIRQVNARLPWQNTCLIQALAARQMLRRRQIANVLYFGVAANATNAFVAHAWLAVDQHILTGQRGHNQFSVLSIFVDEGQF